MTRTGAGRLPMLLALVFWAGCASSGGTRLSRLPLAQRCHLAEMAALFSYEIDPRVPPESIPDGMCAKQLASSSNERRLLRVEVDTRRDQQFSSTSLFGPSDSCSWKTLQLVTDDWDKLPASVDAIVLLSFQEDEKNQGAFPFDVGVQPRPSGPGIDMSPCGVVSGRLESRGGAWTVRY